MISLLTNASAMSAIRVLADGQKAADGVERQLSTGLRVSDASDNAAYWSIGVTMRSRVGAIAAVQDSLSLSAGLLGVTKAGLDAVLASMTDIRNDVLKALQGGIDRSVLQQDIDAHRSAMVSAAGNASFNGINLLTTTASYVESTTESRVVNGSTFVSEAGTDTYTLSDSLGRKSTYQDQFSVDATGHRTYASVAAIPARPFSTLQLPASSDGSTLGTLNVDLDGLNLVQSYGFTADVAPYPGDHAQLTISDVSTTPATDTTSTDTQYYNQARGGQIASSVAGANVFNQTVSLHAFSGVAKAIGAYVTSPYVTGAYNSWTPFQPNDGDVVTVRPYMSIANLSVVDGVEHFTNGTTAAYHLGDDDIHALAGLVESDMAQVRTAQAKVGSYINGISVQRDFNAALTDALNSGIGKLVDADMDVTSTRLKALKTQQQLGLQALSVANDNTKSILKLFG